MKLLLDENLPKRLKHDLSELDVFTVREKGWNGLTNGEFLNQMISDGIQALITFDKNLEHQQNFRIHPVTVIVLSAESNQYKHVQPLVPQIKLLLADAKIGTTVIE